jgi:hypothetical protein
MSQIAAPTPNAAAVVPMSGQGEKLARPMPEPSISRMSDIAVAAAAPAQIAPQLTAETGASLPPAPAPGAVSMTRAGWTMVAPVTSEGR